MASTTVDGRPAVGATAAISNEEQLPQILERGPEAPVDKPCRYKIGSSSEGGGHHLSPNGYTLVSNHGEKIICSTSSRNQPPMIAETRLKKA